MTRGALAVVALAALSTGCSLVIGDIELPAEELDGVDAESMRRDADVPPPTPDATGPDTGPVRDAAPVPADVAPPVADVPVTPPADAWVPPPDGSPPPPDAAPPPPDAAPLTPDVPVAPPPDLSAVAGYWYLDGLAPDENGQPAAFAAALRIERNRADLLTNEAVPLARDVSLVPAPDLRGTWLLTLPPTGQVYRGAFAPETGFAVFAPEDRAGGPAAVLLLARANEDRPSTPADALTYVRIARTPPEGEFGALRQVGANAYQQEGRTSTPDETRLDDRPLDFWNVDPWRWLLTDPSTGGEFELVPTRSGLGAIAVERLAPDGGVGLLLGWAMRAPDALPRAGDLYCGGVLQDPQSGDARPLSLAATVTPEGRLQWVGGYDQGLSAANGVYALWDGVNPFQLQSGWALSDGLDEVLVVAPDSPVEGLMAWGLMACVRTDLVPSPL